MKGREGKAERRDGNETERIWKEGRREARKGGRKGGRKEKKGGQILLTFLHGKSMLGRDGKASDDGYSNVIHSF